MWKQTNKLPNIVHPRDKPYFGKCHRSSRSPIIQALLLRGSHNPCLCVMLTYSTFKRHFYVKNVRLNSRTLAMIWGIWTVSQYTDVIPCTWGWLICARSFAKTTVCSIASKCVLNKWHLTWSLACLANSYWSSVIILTTCRDYWTNCNYFLKQEHFLYYYW